MARVPYGPGEPEPTRPILPQMQAPNDVRRIQANPAAFGALIAQGGEKLGQGATVAGRFFGQVATDGATNSALQEVNGVLSHYQSLSGQDRLAAQKQTTDQINQIFAKYRGGLTTPEQQLQYDTATRNYQNRYVAERMSWATDQAQKETAAAVNRGTVETAVNSAAAVANNPELVGAAWHVGKSGVVKQLLVDGFEKDPTITAARFAEYNQRFYGTVALSKATTDPVGAIDFINAHRADLGAAYPKLYDEFRTRALPIQRDAIISQALAAAGASGTPRGLRNNNPGNIEASPWAQSQPGFVGSDGRFARFATPEAGQAAMAKLLTNYGDQGLTTIQAIVNKWAPAGDGANNPGAYAATVSKSMGVAPDAQLNMKDSATVKKLAESMAAVEQGRSVAFGSQGGSGSLPDESTAIAHGLALAGGDAELQRAVVSGIRERYSIFDAATATQRDKIKQDAPNVIAATEHGALGLALPSDLAILPPEEADAYRQQFRVAQVAGSALNAARWASPADLAQIQQTIRTAQPFVAAGADPALAAREQRMASARLDQLVKERNAMLIGPHSDPALYVAQSPTVAPALQAIDPKNPATFAAYAQRSLAVQSYLGVPVSAQHVLTRAQATDMAAKIMSPSGDAKQTLSAMQAQYGSSWPQVFHDAVTLGKLPAAYQAVSVLSDSRDADLLSRWLQEQPAKDKALDSILPSMPGAKSSSARIRSDIDSDSSVELFRQSLVKQGSSPAQVSAITDSIAQLAFARAYYDRDTSASADAVKAFTDQYDFSLPGGARVPVAIKDQVDAGARTVLAGLNANTVAIPPLFGQPGQPTQAEYLDSLKAAPTWINSPKSDAVWLMDAGGRIVRGRNGQPLAVPFPTPPAPQTFGSASARAIVTGAL